MALLSQVLHRKWSRPEKKIGYEWTMITGMSCFNKEKGGYKKKLVDFDKRYILFKGPLSLSKFSIKILDKVSVVTIKVF
jgi:hypothetical protein